METYVSTVVGQSLVVRQSLVLAQNATPPELATLANWLAQYALWITLGAMTVGFAGIAVTTLTGVTSTRARATVYAAVVAAALIGACSAIVTAYSELFPQ